MTEFARPRNLTVGKRTFPHAPFDWDEGDVLRIARDEHLSLSEDHLDLVRALQEYMSRNEDDVNMRELHDALEEKFHHKGGMKYLYQLLPGGPVVQGCKLAGLAVPAGASDDSFGSVQ